MIHRINTINDLFNVITKQGNAKSIQGRFDSLLYELANVNDINRLTNNEGSRLNVKSITVDDENDYKFEIVYGFFLTVRKNKLCRFNVITGRDDDGELFGDIVYGGNIKETIILPRIDLHKPTIENAMKLLNTIKNG